MTEDILEQLVDDYLKFNGFFTAHKRKFAAGLPLTRNMSKKTIALPAMWMLSGSIRSVKALAELG